MGKEATGPRIVGRYVLHEEFASGGMASVHFGRLVDDGGSSRVVAIKKLHPQHAKDPSFVAMLLDEARLSARVRHPNVALVLDVVVTDGEVFLVMEYVHGESLSGLSRAALKRGGPIPTRIVSSVVGGMLEGLDAAHRATNEEGEPLGVVHRDVSPENVIVGVDGIARILDFGVALARGRAQVTRQGGLKGKLGYMAPELLEGLKATPLADVYSAGVVLWEMLVGKRLFTGGHEGSILAKVLRGDVPKPSSLAPLPLRIDEVVLRAAARKPSDRYPTAHDFAVALEACLKPAPTREVAAWVDEIAAVSLSRRADLLAAVEREATRLRPDVASVSAIPSLVPNDAGPQEDTEIMVGTPPLVDVLPRATHPLPPREKPSEIAKSREPVRPRRTRLIVIGALTFATFAGGIALGTHYSGGSHAAVPVVPVVAATPLDSASPVLAPTPSASVEATPPEEPSADLPPPSASSEPPVASSSSSKAPTRGGPRRGNHGGHVRNCDPPFRMDEKGIRHLKPECL